MYKITVIGLGSEAKDLSNQALNIINSHENLIARTALTTSYKALNKDIKSLDFIYDKIVSNYLKGESIKCPRNLLFTVPRMNWKAVCP